MVSEILVKIVAVILLISVAVVLILGIKTLFKGNEDKNYRFLENDKVKRLETLAFIYLTAIVIKNGMNILGVSLPEKM